MNLPRCCMLLPLFLFTPQNSLLRLSEDPTYLNNKTQRLRFSQPWKPPSYYLTWKLWTLAMVFTPNEYTPASIRKHIPQRPRDRYWDSGWRSEKQNGRLSAGSYRYLRPKWTIMPRWILKLGLNLRPVSSCLICLSSVGIKGIQHHCPASMAKLAWLLRLEVCAITAWLAWLTSVTVLHSYLQVSFIY